MDRMKFAPIAFLRALLQSGAALALIATGCNYSSIQVSTSSLPSDSHSSSTEGGWKPGQYKACTVPPVTITHTPGFQQSAVQTVFVDTAKYPQALCNDGTPAVFGIRPGFGAAAKRWVIWTEGGASCYDVASCTDRFNTTPGLTSSNDYLTSQLNPGTGPMIPDATKNPDFYDATAVRIHYCSSDQWSGNKAADPNQPGVIPAGWHFRGHEIYKAVIQTLIAQYGLGSATEVMYGGDSAGGLGVYNNINILAQLLPSSVRLVGVTDAGFANPVAGFDPNEPDGISKASGTPYDLWTPTALSLWGGSGDVYCDAMSTLLQDKLNCSFGPIVMGTGSFGTVQIPVFTRQSLADGVQLKQEGLDLYAVPAPPAQQAASYQRFFATQMTAAMQATNNFTTVFAPADTQHGQMNTNNFYQKLYTFPNQVSLYMNQAMGIWYSNPCQINRWIQPVP